jgi:hypothetical protein
MAVAVANTTLLVHWHSDNRGNIDSLGKGHSHNLYPGPFVAFMSSPLLTGN